MFVSVKGVAYVWLYVLAGILAYWFNIGNSRQQCLFYAFMIVSLSKIMICTGIFNTGYFVGRGGGGSMSIDLWYHFKCFCLLLSAFVFHQHE